MSFLISLLPFGNVGFCIIYPVKRLLFGGIRSCTIFFLFHISVFQIVEFEN